MCLTFYNSLCTTFRESHHLYQLWIVSRSISSTSTATLVHAFIVNRADHCSSPYYGLAQVRLQPLDGFLRMADRMIGGVPKYDHISDYMPDIIHLLPGHTLYRVSSFVWHCFLGIAPTGALHPHFGLLWPTISLFDFQR